MDHATTQTPHPHHRATLTTNQQSPSHFFSPFTSHLLSSKLNSTPLHFSLFLFFFFTSPTIVIHPHFLSSAS